MKKTTDWFHRVRWSTIGYTSLEILRYVTEILQVGASALHFSQWLLLSFATMGLFIFWRLTRKKNQQLALAWVVVLGIIQLGNFVSASQHIPWSRTFSNEQAFCQITQFVCFPVCVLWFILLVGFFFFHRTQKRRITKKKKVRWQTISTLLVGLSFATMGMNHTYLVNVADTSHRVDISQAGIFLYGFYLWETWHPVFLGLVCGAMVFHFIARWWAGVFCFLASLWLGVAGLAVIYTSVLARSSSSLSWSSRFVSDFFACLLIMFLALGFYWLGESNQA